MLDIELEAAAINLAKGSNRTYGAVSDPAADARLNRAEFVWDYKVNPEAVKKGMDFSRCFHKRLFVKIGTPATRDVAYIPASETEKQLYSAAYNFFMRREEAEEKGMPLKCIQQFTPIYRQCFNTGIFTVEQLALAPVDNDDTAMGLFKLAAVQYLKASRGGVEKTPDHGKPAAVKRGRPRKGKEDVDD